VRFFTTLYDTAIQKTIIFKMRVVFLWTMSLCSPAGDCEDFEGTCCLQLSGRKKGIKSEEEEDEGTMFLQNVYTHLLD
jgi:hypothetical protein